MQFKKRRFRRFFISELLIFHQPAINIRAAYTHNPYKGRDATELIKVSL